MLTVPEAPHNSFIFFDSWDRNSPTSFFFQPLWGGYRSFICLASDPSPTFTLLYSDLYGWQPLPTMFQDPLHLPLGEKHRRALKGKSKRKPVHFSPLSLLLHHLLRGCTPLCPKLCGPSSHQAGSHDSCFHWWPQLSLPPSTLELVAASYSCKS